MEVIPLIDVPHQIFTALLGNVRAELDVQYNEICDRFYINLSVDDVCVGAFKMIDRSLLVRNCSPSDFGDLLFVGDIGREAVNSGTLYYLTPAEAEILQANGY